MGISYCQINVSDSMLKAVADTRSLPVDTFHVNRLRELGHDLIEQDSALSRQVLKESLDKSLTVKETDAITNCYRILGIWHSYFGDNDSAIIYYRYSLNSSLKNKNQYLEAGANFNIGNIKYWKGEYDSCIYYYQKAAVIYEDENFLKKDKSVTENKLDLRKSDLYSNLSIVFNTLKNIDKADEYIDKAITIAKKYKSPAAANTLAYYMQQKADNYYENGNVEKALAIRLSFLPALESGINKKTYVQSAYQNIATEYFDLMKFDSAKYYAEKSLKLANELNIPGSKASSYLMLSHIAVHDKKYTEAESLIANAKDFYENFSDDPAEKINYYNVRHKLAAAQGKYADAYAYLDAYTKLNDSLFYSNKAKEFQEREMRYETEKKEAKLLLQQSDIKQKNILITALILGAVILLALIFFIFKNTKHKQKLQEQKIAELETEKQLSATEAVLKGEEQERIRLAKDLHDGLGGILSGVKHSLGSMKGNLILTQENARAFERSMDMLDSSIKEMRRVAHNMMPEALVKFGLNDALKDFCNDINASTQINVSYQSIGMENIKLEQTTSIAVYRIVQELLNNILKHAGATSAIVQLSNTDNSLTLTVEDDGKGFDKTKLENSKGIGWSSIQNRVEFLKGTLDLDTSDKGTSIHIEIKK